MRTALVQDPDLSIYVGDCLEVLTEMEPGSVDACVTSPPYLDARPEYDSPTLEDFALIFQELRSVVRGPLLLNVGRLWSNRCENLWWIDVIKRAESAGWPLRDTLVWVKKNPNPIQGELLTSAHEYVFLFGDGFNLDEVRTEYSPESIARYGRRYDANAGVKGKSRPDHCDPRVGSENANGARPRSTFETSVGSEKGNPHPAPMAPALAAHLVKLATTSGGTILDPFGGSGNTAVAARALGRKAVLIEISSEYAELASRRLAQQSLLGSDAY